MVFMLQDVDEDGGFMFQFIKFGEMLGLRSWGRSEWRSVYYYGDLGILDLLQVLEVGIGLNILEDVLFMFVDKDLICLVLILWYRCFILLLKEGVICSVCLCGLIFYFVIILEVLGGISSNSLQVNS